MSYTKTELIDAYCKAKGFEETEDKTKSQFIQEEKVLIEQQIQEQIQRIGSANDVMKRVAFMQIQKDISEEINGVDL
jgi:hypothetical protein